jgi:predicted anti-sigma-YlaC factor YlaD
MTAQTWHLDPDLAERYASGQASRVASASIEQHLIGCGACRGLLTPYAEPQRIDRIWVGVLERVEAPPLRPLERLLRACGMADSTARLLAVTPTLRGSWITGVVIVLVIAELSANNSPSGVALFMALAPVLPLISVAAAFGGEMDPSRGMVGAAPYSLLRLLLVRTAAVVACTLVPAAALALLLPASTWLAMGWLLPSLALTGAVLVLTPRAPALPVAGTLAACWMALVGFGWLRHHDPFLAASLDVQLASVAVLVTTVTLLVIRQDHFAEEIRRAP